MRLVVVTVPGSDAEVASDRLWVAGAQAIEERSVDDGMVELRTQLAADDETSIGRLGPVPVDWIVTFVDGDEAPAETWRQFSEPIRVSDRLVIHPAWREPGAGELAIGIEPGGSFGLGDHPTTRLSALALDDLVRPGDLVLDVGCGSGVLAILAACRGAAGVVAIDIAEAAREATADNAIRNGVAEKIAVSVRPVNTVSGEFDVVVANILAPALVAMAPSLRRLTRPSGHLVISGVLTDAHDHVTDALRPMRVVREHRLDGWSAVVLAH